MRRSDLRRRCIVDRLSVFDFIRTITLAGARVRFAFDNKASFELGEGGFYLEAIFDSAAAAVAYLEEYLGRPFGEWTLFRAGAYPAAFDATIPQGSFWTALRENRIDLPHPDHFVLVNSECLRDRLPFPSRYRARG